MRYALLALSIALAFLCSCSPEKLTAEQPKIEVSIVTDGYSYRSTKDEFTEKQALSVNLGGVPVYSSRQAGFMINNPSTAKLNIKAIAVVDSVGTKWSQAQTYVRAEDTNTWQENTEMPFSLLANTSSKLVVAYEPNTEGDHHLKLEIESDDPVHPKIIINVDANGFFTGSPDIEISYQSLTVPALTDCQQGVCKVAETQALNFGNLMVGQQGSARLVLRNKAECANNPSVDACDSCVLIVKADPTQQNLGLGFKPGSNAQNYFNLISTAELPTNIQQKNAQCQSPGEREVQVTFNAPLIEGQFKSTLIVESNDQDARVIEIPVVARVLNSPIAIAKFRAFDAQSPTAPWTNPEDLEPLERIYFDGRKSYQPPDVNNNAAIVEYSWSIITAPLGVNRSDFQIQQQNGLFSFWAPLAGDYVVSLKVKNRDGVWSGETEASKVAFSVVPKSRMHIQLTWDDTINDQDLHLTFASRDDRVCTRGADCYFSDKQPQWFSDVPAGTGPNPRLDIDDVNGQGPENINIDAPRAGTYRIYVHYFRGSQPTRLTLRVWLNGLNVAEYRRTISGTGDVWAAADITWFDNNTGRVSPLRSDRAGEVGSIQRIPACTALSGSGF